MREISTVVLLTHRKRAKELVALRKLVSLQADPLGIPVVVSLDARWNNIRLNYAQALTIKGGEGKWRLILHDDVQVPKGALEKLSYIFSQLPDDRVVAAYCPANAAFDEVAEQGRHLAETVANFWGLAIAFPEKLTKEIAYFFLHEFPPENVADDTSLAAWLYRTNRKMLCIVPSIFQHFGAFRSIIGNPGKAGGRFRASDMFDPDFDPKKVDWKKELENPVQAKGGVRALPISRESFIYEEKA